MYTTEKAKPVVCISGVTGDCCGLIGKVSRALRNAGQKEEAKEFKKECQCISDPELIEDVALYFVTFKTHGKRK